MLLDIKFDEVVEAVETRVEETEDDDSSRLVVVPCAVCETDVDIERVMTEDEKEVL